MPHVCWPFQIVGDAQRYSFQGQSLKSVKECWIKEEILFLILRMCDDIRFDESSPQISIARSVAFWHFKGLKSDDFIKREPL